MEERRDCGRRWKRVEEIVEGATKLWFSERLHNLSPPDGLSRVLMITALPAQISASNFHDLTQITQRRVRFNPKRTVFPCALG